MLCFVLYVFEPCPCPCVAVFPVMYVFENIQSNLNVYVLGSTCQQNVTFLFVSVCAGSSGPAQGPGGAEGPAGRHSETDGG